MTRHRFEVFLAICVLAAIGFSAWVEVNNAARNQQVALRNCANIAGLARIERAFISRQEEQSRGLLEHGITFGIPPSLLPTLIRRSRESQRLFLRQLDRLTVKNCVANSPELPHLGLVLKGVVPGKETPLGLAGRFRL